MKLVEYKKINTSFKRDCVYRIGNEAGFFSEINNMLMAMVFCLENRLQFKLYSANSNFGDDIWKDYLRPFTKHTNAKSHRLYNERPYIHKRPYPFNIGQIFSIKKRLSNQFLTQDIWPYIRNKDVYNDDYMVDTPYIKGSLTSVTSELIRCIWNYNDYAKNHIEELISMLNISERYAAFFVRRGDKYIEAPEEEIERYVDKIDKITNSDNFPLFISSDDFRVIEEVKRLYPERIIYHFNFQNDKGYYMGDFISNYSKQEQKQKIVQLLAQVEMLINASYFVGTYSSNVGVFVGMARNQENSYDINDKQWLLW